MGQFLFINSKKLGKHSLGIDTAFAMLYYPPTHHLGVFDQPRGQGDLFIALSKWKKHFAGLASHNYSLIMCMKKRWSSPGWPSQAFVIGWYGRRAWIKRGKKLDIRLAVWLMAAHRHRAEESPSGGVPQWRSPQRSLQSTTHYWKHTLLVYRIALHWLLKRYL